MKKILTILAVLIMISCTKSSKKENPAEISETFQVNGKTISIITIDSCEYFYHFSTNSAFLEHKGNCKNSIHKQDGNQ